VGLLALVSVVRQFERMPVRVADEKRPGETEAGIGEGAKARRDEPDMRVEEGFLEGDRVVRAEARLPVPEVVRPAVGGRGPSVAGHEVLQELDARARGCPKGGDPQARPEDAVQVLLLLTPVLARAGNAEAEEVAVELQAGIRVGDDDGRMVDAEKEQISRTRAAPLRVSLPLREPDQLESVAVRVLEVEGLDAAGVRVPSGPVEAWTTFASRRRA
jgi:hypothetical protein